MSDLKVRLLLEAEAAAALRALEQTQAELREAGDAAREAGLAGAAGADRLGDAFDRAGDRARSGFQAVVAGGAAAERSNLAVAGSAASVGAQFNDIAIMWAAGQSPFMTAIQQGTQLNQILGGQGLAGAAATARAAFATMFNPFSIGLIAALTLGGTFVQWLFDASEGATSLEDRLADLMDAHKALAKAAKDSAVDEAELTKAFGSQAQAIRELRDEQERLQASRADRAETSVARGVPDDIASGNGWLDGNLSEADAAADLFEVQGNIAQAIMLGLRDAAQQVDEASDLSGRIAAMEVLLGLYRDAARLSGETSAAEEKHLLDLGAAILSMRERLAQQDAARPPAQTRFPDARDGDARATARDDFETNQRAADGELRAATAELRQQADLQALVARYGRDSWQVANARATAERAVVVQMLAASGAAETVRQQYLAAWDAANGLANTPVAKAVSAAEAVALLLAGNLNEAGDAANRVAGADIAGGISRALGPAAALAARLWDAAAAAAAASARSVAQGEAVGGGRGLGPQGPALDPYGFRDQLSRQNRPAVPSGGSARGGGGGGGGAPAGDTVASLRAEAAAALAALDVAVAAIGVKVEAGLESSAEAADGVAAAKDRAADELAELVARLQAMGPAGQAAAEQLRGSLDGLVPAANRLSDTLEDGFKGPFEDFVAGASSAKDAFADFAGFIQRKLAEIVANQVWDGLVGPLLGGFGGGFGGGGGLGGLFGGLLGGGDLFAGLFASGGAPLSSMANRVVGTPTLFSMGDGRTGLLGEQDDEAILPLRGQGALALLPGGGEARLPLARGAGGDLGIVLPPDLLAAMQPFARGGAPRFAVPGAPELRRDLGGAAAPAAPGGGFGPAAPAKISLVINNTGEPVQAEAEVRQQGDDITIELMMERVDAGLARNLQTNRGALAAALQRNFGLQRRGQ